ncbi:Protein kinase-like domain protein [Metarhizium guizhouense ARSEF 977]|uniref:Protein kinase-like domain protein n=1 Tax=Metarhizium guizhouense (strain ARSEF 977) TaxID=1276136 RepID=A0A0B4GWV3_METGA|nr:Protein kinase-like domain protein [Metarhizium guizhouense ARSEF 977]
MTDSPPLGNVSWKGVGGDAEEYAERIHKFIDKIDNKALESYASSLRGNQPCKISTDFSVGNFNLVRKIQFHDGVEWIVRLLMPPVPVAGQLVETVSAKAREKRLLSMQSELATMEFVRQNTDIPIPKIYAHELNEQNAVGCPFFMMEYVHGNTAEEVSQSYPGNREGIPELFREKFWRQIANIMTQLASVRLPRIGSIVRDAAGSFVAGPLIETGSGPYDSAAEFYADYPLALGNSLAEREGPVDGQGEVIQAFCSLAASFPPPAARAERGSAEDFGLANYDLNPNNILVDGEFNVLAVIDWDSVVSVPDAALYRFPYLMGVRCAVPGVVSTERLELKREALSQQFAEVVEAWGKEQLEKEFRGVNKRRVYLFTKSGFFSKEAVAFRSLIAVRQGQDWVNEEWIQGLAWLSDRNEEQVARFYLEQ